MAWARLNDGIFDHPKCIDAGEDATNLFVRSIVWCSKQLTDGRIPKAALRVLTQRRDADALAAKLLEVGLWEDRDGAWWVHDFLDYNPSRESVEGRRADVSAKRSAAGKAGNAKRWGSQDDRKAIANGSQTDRKSSQPVIANASPRPVPSPPQEEEEDKTSNSQPSDTRDRSGAVAPLSLLPDEAPKADRPAEVFAHWQRATDHPRAKLDAKRRTLIARALKDHSAADLMRAIDGYAASPWHRGENDRGTKYLGLELILRDAAHIERGHALADEHAPKAPPPRPAAPPAAPVSMRPVLSPEAFVEAARKARAALLEETRGLREPQGGDA